MTTPSQDDHNAADHRRHTRDAYDRLAAVWAATTDDGPFNGLLERPALRSLIPEHLAGQADTPTFIVYRLRLAGRSA